jgi:hypothetical protein
MVDVTFSAPVGVLARGETSDQLQSAPVLDRSLQAAAWFGQILQESEGV